MALLQKHFDMALETPDGIKKLRELILTLAMKGKLVPQDQKDPPASELLREIEAEKKRLVKEEKIKKQDSSSPIKPEEIPYAVPTGWEWVRLDQIAEYNGRAKANPNDISPETWVLDLEDIEKDTSIIINRAVYADRQSKSTKSTFCKGDVLYGKLRPYLNKVVVADEAGVCTTEIVPIVPFNGVDSSFLKALLKRPSFIAHVNELSYGVKMPRLGTSDAIKTVHPLPPFAEQKRIVSKIDRLMALCDKLEAERNEKNDKRLKIHTAAIKNLFSASDKVSFNLSWNFITKNFNTIYSVAENVEQLKREILQLAMMGKLVPQNSKDQPAKELLKEFEDEKKRLLKEGKIKNQELLPPIKPKEIPYNLPSGWEWARLGDVGETNIGLTYSPSDIADRGTIVLRSSNIQDGKLDFLDLVRVNAEIKKSAFVQEGDLLICARNGSKALVGKTALITGLSEEMAFGAFMAIFRSRINPYLFQFINSPLFRQMIDEVNTMTINQITQNNLKMTIFPLPPLAEQQRIVAKIDQLMALCNTLERTLKESSDKQTAILDAVLVKL
ncbi:MAG: restriction endonuclease subunit S [Desulfobulbaceae bacterium]|nr:restriction endonuclease subunit S [Desulfobulbaceae bacterium]